MKKSLKTTTKSGFTIVEFSIAMAFIAVLLIFVSVVINNILATYQKGLSLKAVNNVGRNLVDELVSSINAAPSVDTNSLCRSYLKNNVDKCIEDHASNFIYQELTGDYEFEKEDTKPVQYAGVFCTGKYSYIWNTYYGQEKGEIFTLYYNNKTKLTGTDNGNKKDSKGDPIVRLARFEDPTYLACSTRVKDNYDINNSIKDIDISKLANGRTNTIATPEQHFLTSFDLDLQLYELTMFPISQDQVTLRTFMSGTFILATNRGNVNITRSGDYCDIENRLKDVEGYEDASDLLDLGAEFNYCAINRFNFAARTAGL